MKTIAWGTKVSQEFLERLVNVCERLEVEPNDLMACMAFETGESFDPAQKNGAGSGAVGLIQFMPQTAMALGTTVEDLAVLSATAQLYYVEQYFLPRRGQLGSLADLYMAILWPSAIGKPLEYILFDKSDPYHPKRYAQNAGLDYNADGVITKAEAVERVRRKLEKGLLPDNRADVEL